MEREFNWIKWYTPKMRIVSHVVFWLLITALYYFNYTRISKDSAWLFVIKELFVTGCLYYSASWIIQTSKIKGKLYSLILFFALAYVWWLTATYILCYVAQTFMGESDERFNRYIHFVIGDGFLGLFKFRKLSALFMDFVFMVTIPLAPKLTKLAMDNAMKVVKLERDNLALELDFLKSQVSPHFLFNVLNSIYWMSEKNDPKTPKTVLQLSNLMRYVLYEVKDDEILLNKEIDFIVNYIDLAKLRYGDTVAIKDDIRSVDEPYKIIPLILIPFVENAFKHGPDRNRDHAWVEVSLKMDNDRLIFNVKNGVNDLVEKSVFGGVGMRNVARRLELGYPGRHKLDIKNNDGIYSVELIIDLK